jgi:hypothetical protein
MSEEETKTVKMVYSRFIENETQDWAKIDDVLAIIAELSNEELISESAIKYLEHSKGILRCEDDHDHRYCMAPLILEAVGAILTLYGETKTLHPKNAYILCYYLSLSELDILYLK